MTRWEYCTVPLLKDGDADPSFGMLIEDLGELGWEMVTATDTRAWFKRPLDEAPNK